MVITRIETFLVAPRWLFCRIETSDGIVGWGEPVIEGRAHTVRAAIEELTPLLIGTDPLATEDHWQVLTKGGFYRGGPILSSAVAGIDQALWDIKGKHFNAPVHSLLGGPVRDRMRVYSWVGGDEPAEIEDAISAQMEAGFTAVKMNAVGKVGVSASVAVLNGMVERATTAREILGPERDFALDFHGRLAINDSLRALPLLTETMPLFVEEPVLPGHLGQIERLTDLGVPIAVGERVFAKEDFISLLGAGVAIVQPDISHAGGISEVARIATLADAWNARIAPHCPLGPIALASSLQVAFMAPNFLIQEQSMGIHYNTDNDIADYLVDTTVFDFVDGHVERLTGPGLGIEVDEAAVRAADKIGHNWHAPIWRDDSGAFMEW